MFKKNEIANVRMGLHNRPCRVRIVDVVGDDAMVQLNNGTVSIVDVRELLPILEGKEKVSRRREKGEHKEFKVGNLVRVKTENRIKGSQS